MNNHCPRKRGRPFTGAWIETTSPAALADCCRSPLHGGVDRNHYLLTETAHPWGRPFTGAWIETRSTQPSAPRHAVAPSRGRGSKPTRDEMDRAIVESPLHGGVDRNSKTAKGHMADHSRPFTGAWIETCLTCRCYGPDGVAPSRGRGSKLATNRVANYTQMSPLHGGVDRNRTLPDGTVEMLVAPSRGRGSKLQMPTGAGKTVGRPFTGAWIETQRGKSFRLRIEVAPSRGRGSKP